MKAIICTAYGEPEVLELREVARPEPRDNEVLIKVHAASVGPSDSAFRRGDPFIVRMIYGLRRPRQPILGTELAGEIEAVGKAVTQFKAGDRVFGLSTAAGAYAEYKCLAEDKPLVRLPDCMSYEEGVAICDGAPTALTFLRDKARLKAGQRVLINGASGAVGIYAIQLAKRMGAEVTGVCGTSNVDLVKEMGADSVVDYTRADFTATGDRYDIIFDAVGKRSFRSCKAALKPGGIYMTTVPSFTIMLQMLWTAAFGRQKALFATAGLMQNKANMGLLAEWFETGLLRPAIDRRYSLERIVEAHRYVDTGHKKGNVVLVLPVSL